MNPTNQQPQNIGLNESQLIYRSYVTISPAGNAYQQQHHQQNNHQQVIQCQPQPLHAQHQIQNQKVQTQQQYNSNFRKSFMPTGPATLRYTATNGPTQITVNPPVYTPSPNFQRQIPSQQLPPPSSMISPPMEKNLGTNTIHWQPNVQQPFVLPPVGGVASPIFAMSSYLSDDRSLETPAPMPVECQLGTPDTPSPSLPSHSPPVDPICDPSYFLTGFLSDDSGVAPKKRRESHSSENANHKKRHRRTQSEMAADRLEALKKTCKRCTVRLIPVDLKKDETARLFVGSKTAHIGKNIPRIPRMKRVQINFKRVSAIGFMKTKHGIMFSCLDECKFKSYDPVKFQGHLKRHEKPSNDNQVKTCSLCSATVRRDSLLFEFAHMLKAHLSPQDIANLPVEEILYSKILRTCSDPPSAESEDESEATVIYSRPSTPRLCSTPERACEDASPVVQDEALEEATNANPQDTSGTSECSQDRADELAQATVTEKEAKDDLLPEEVDELLGDFEHFAENPVVESAENKDPDYVPNEENESEVENIQEQAVESERDEATTDTSTEEDSDDSEPPGSPLLEKSYQLRQTGRRRVPPIRLSTDYVTHGFEDEEDPSGDEEKQAKTAPIRMNLNLKQIKERKEKDRNEARSQRRLTRNKRQLSTHDEKSSSEEKENSLDKPEHKQKRRRIVPQSESSNESDDEDCNDDLPLAQISRNIVAQPSTDVLEPAVDNKSSEETQSIERDEIDGSPETSSAPAVDPGFLTRLPDRVLSRIMKSKYHGTGGHEETPKPLVDNSEPAVINETVEPGPTSEPLAASSSTSEILEALIEPESTQNSVATQKSHDPIDKATKKTRVTPKKRFEGLPTARKSSSKPHDFNIGKVLKNFNVKQCTVRLVNSKDQIKSIIRNAKKAGLPIASGSEKLSTVDLAEMLAVDEPSKHFLPQANANDIIPEEIDLDEDEANGEEDFPPVENKVFPKNGEAAKRKISEKIETDDELFFDCENIELPPTPLDAEAVTVDDTDDDVIPLDEAANEPMIVLNKPPGKLVNLSRFYPWIDDDLVDKWPKTESCAEAMLKDQFLFSTYKCMSSSCSYFTTDIDKFETHIEKHRGIDKHFTCSFCLLDELEPKHLITHLKKEHKHDRYQCSKCMYRSCEKFYCEKHQKEFHAKDESNCNQVVICESPVQKDVLPTERRALQDHLESNLRKFVKPIPCKFCSKTFFLLDTYVEHLQRELELWSGAHKLEQISKEIKEMNLELENTTAECRFGILQCVYCEDSFNDEDLMWEHLSVIHPMKLAFCAKREQFFERSTILNLFETSQESIQVRRWADVNKSGDISKLTGNDSTAPGQILILNAFSLSAKQR